jgi:hypothetical protein
MMHSKHKHILSLTASILAAGSAQAYDLSLGTNLPPVVFHGFASQGFLDSSKYNYLGDTTRGSFNFSEAGLNASMDPFPHTHITAQGFLFDVGNVGQYNPSLDYALVDYNVSDAFGIRAGRIIRPEGIYNSIQSIDLARTSVLLPQGMYDARYRDFSGAVDGGSLYGSFNLHKAGSLSYEIFGGEVNLASDGGIARYLEDAFRSPYTIYGGVNGFPEVGGQFWWNTPLDGLRLGVSLDNAFGFSYDYQAFNGVGFTPIHAVTDALEQQYSVEYLWKSWTFQAEYQYEDYNDHNEIHGVSQPGTHSANDTWYAAADYRFNKWFDAGAYYTEHYNDVTARGEPLNYQKDLALSLRFDPTSWWVFKLEGHCIHGTALLHDNTDNPVQNQNGKPWYMLAVKTTFSF